MDFRSPSGEPGEEANDENGREKDALGGSLEAADVPARYRQLLTVGKETLELHVWAKRRGVRPGLIYHRRYQGWSDEEAVLLPLGAVRPGVRPRRPPPLKLRPERIGNAVIEALLDSGLALSADQRARVVTRVLERVAKPAGSGCLPVIAVRQR